MTTIDELLVKIDASTELLRRELNKGEAAVGQFERRTDGRLDSVEKRFSKLGGVVRTALGAFGVSLGVAGVTRFVTSAVQTADAIGEASKAAGLGAERFQRLQFVFGQNGIEANEYAQAMQTLNRNLGQFITTGGGRAAKAIEELGLKQRIANGEIQTSEQLFDAVVEALGRVTNAAQAAALAGQLFGQDVGPRMVQTLRLGVAAMRDAEAAAKGIFTDEQVARADEINDKFNELAQTIGVKLKGALLDAYEGWRLFLAPNETEALTARMAELNKLIAVTEARIDRLGGGDLTNLGRQQEITAAISNLKAYREELDKLWGARQDADYERLLRIPFIQPKRAGGAPAAQGKGQSLSPELDVFIDQLEEAAQLTRSMRTELEQQLETWRSTVELFSAGMIDEETATRVRDSLLQPIDVTAKRMKEVKDDAKSLFDDFAVSVGSGLQRVLADAFLGISNDWRDMLKTMAAELASSALINALGGALSGASGQVGSFFSLAFGGQKRHSGGPVSAGTPYLVKPDEEIFVPDVAGRVKTVAQARAGMGGGGVKVIVNNTAAPHVKAEARQAGPGLIEVMVGAINGEFARGSFDQAFSHRFGMRPTTGMR